MYSFNARRNEASPNRMSLDRHSCRMEHTQRSAKAFRFELLRGRANGRISSIDRVAENGQRSDDAVVSPAGVLSGEAHNEGFQFGRDAGPAWGSTEFGAVEFAGNKPPVP